MIGSERFSTRNIKIVSRKQQYHDDAYDFSASKHILIEDRSAMTMDGTGAFYRGRDARTGEDQGVEDFVVRTTPFGVLCAPFRTPKWKP